MKHVMAIVPSLRMGGAEIQALRNCDALLGAGYQVTLVTIFQVKGAFFEPYLEELKSRGMGFQALLDEDVQEGSRGVLHFFSVLARASMKLARSSYKPDVVYTRLWYASLLAWVAFRRPRLVFNEESRLKPRGVKDWLRLFLLRRAGTWVVPCRGLYDEAVALGTPAPRGCVMPNIVAAAPEVPVRTEGPLTLGFLGRLEPAKGLDRLVAVAAGLKARGVDFRLVVAGSGSQEAGLRGAIATQGLERHVQLLGAVSDLTGFFQGVDLLVLTSRYEGFANVIVEANAYGVPALAMRVPHGPADVIREGENGFLVADGDVEAMVATVAGLDRTRLQAMRAGCRALAEGTYSVQAQQARWQELLR